MQINQSALRYYLTEDAFKQGKPADLTISRKLVTKIERFKSGDFQYKIGRHQNKKLQAQLFKYMFVLDLAPAALQILNQKSSENNDESIISSGTSDENRLVFAAKTLAEML